MKVLKFVGVLVLGVFCTFDLVGTYPEKDRHKEVAHTLGVNPKKEGFRGDVHGFTEHLKSMMRRGLRRAQHAVTFVRDKFGRLKIGSQSVSANSLKRARSGSPSPISSDSGSESPAGVSPGYSSSAASSQLPSPSLADHSDVVSIEKLRKVYIETTKMLLILTSLASKMNIDEETNGERWRGCWRDWEYYNVLPSRWLVESIKRVLSDQDRLMALTEEELLVRLFNLLYGMHLIASTVALPDQLDEVAFGNIATFYGSAPTDGMFISPGFDESVYRDILQNRIPHDARLYRLVENQEFFDNLKKSIESPAAPIDLLLCADKYFSPLDPIQGIIRHIYEVLPLLTMDLVGVENFPFKSGRFNKSPQDFAAWAKNILQVAESFFQRKADAYKYHVYSPVEVERIRQGIPEFFTATFNLMAKFFFYTADIDSMNKKFMQVLNREFTAYQLSPANQTLLQAGSVMECLQRVTAGVGRDVPGIKLDAEDAFISYVKSIRMDDANRDKLIQIARDKKEAAERENVKALFIKMVTE